MRHRNSVRQLGRTYSHRKAMFNNMVTSLFDKERITTTKHKAKELKKISEKLITRAKKNLDFQDNHDKSLHNKREVMKVINDRNVVTKLFNDIAKRFKDRPGGYTRIYLLGNRDGDAAEMAMIELVERPVIEAKENKGSKEKNKKEKKKSK